jgi:hypothetical protein
VKRYEILLMMYEVKCGHLDVTLATNALCSALNAAYARGAGHEGAAAVLQPRLTDNGGPERHVYPVWGDQ